MFCISCCSLDLDILHAQRITGFFKLSGSCIASHAAIFSVAPPLSPHKREWGSDTKNGCVGGYAATPKFKNNACGERVGERH